MPEDFTWTYTADKRKGWVKDMAKKKCVICGKLFTTELDRIVCCSDECKHEKKKADARRWYHENVHEKVEQEKICLVCGKKFTTNRSTQKCCSKECSKKWSNARQAKYAGMYVKHPTTQKYGRGGENYEAIADIAIAARKEGLTYGQYVAKYGNDAWRRANGIND